jgi:hypothetical protein
VSSTTEAAAHCEQCLGSSPATLFLGRCPRVTENGDWHASLHWRAFLVILEPILVIGLASVGDSLSMHSLM